jgi:arylformamidase
MIVSLQINGENYRIDTARFLDISIPLNFNGAQPNAYGVEKARAVACEAGGGLIGDTRRGGSCNFERVSFIPHCNGTHTECVGHITHERISIHDSLKDTFSPAILISVETENANETNESYSIKLNENDKLITGKSIQNSLKNLEKINPESLIIRTLPNSKSKLKQTYLEEIPPFFSTEAMEFIVKIGVKHLLVDLPSIDRIFDEGRLSNHRIFWNVEQGAFEMNENSRASNTITELIFAPENVPDGIYLLNLQIAPFVSDASPSRPILFKILD